MHTIELTQGKFAQLDNADYRKWSKLKWSASKVGRTYYAARATWETDPATGKDHKTTILLHHAVLGFPKNVRISFRDGNGLNCTRRNLVALPLKMNVRHFMNPDVLAFTIQNGT